MSSVRGGEGAEGRELKVVVSGAWRGGGGDCLGVSHLLVGGGYEGGGGKRSLPVWPGWLAG